MERVHRAAGQRIVLGVEKRKDFGVGIAAVSQDGDQPRDVFADALIGQQQRRNIDDAVAADRQKAPLAQQVMDARDHDAETLGDIGKRENVRVGGKYIIGVGNFTHTTHVNC